MAEQTYAHLVFDVAVVGQILERENLIVLRKVFRISGLGLKFYLQVCMKTWLFCILCRRADDLHMRPGRAVWST